jgi:predicted Ser/Thr protein kinase
MSDYKNINVTLNDNGKLYVKNPHGFPVIGMGGHGAVLKIDDQRCIKVFVSEEIANIEKQAYLETLGSPMMPILYEVGDKYLIIEYINGPNLKNFLLLQGNMPHSIVTELVNMFLEMERLCFLRRDESLRHILVKDNAKIKIIDHYYAFTLFNPLPVKLFKQLEELKLLEAFLEEGSKIAPTLFNKFRERMPEYFTDNYRNRGVI